MLFKRKEQDIHASKKLYFLPDQKRLLEGKFSSCWNMMDSQDTFKVVLMLSLVSHVIIPSLRPPGKCPHVFPNSSENKSSLSTMNDFINECFWSQYDTSLSYLLVGLALLALWGRWDKFPSHRHHSSSRVFVFLITHVGEGTEGTGEERGEEPQLLDWNKKRKKVGQRSRTHEWRYQSELGFLSFLPSL